MTLSLRAFARPRFDKVPRHRSPPRTARNLRIERLEGRSVLSTLSALDPCGGSVPIAEGEPTLEAQSTQAPQPTQNNGTAMLIGPLELDAYYASLGYQLPAPEGEDPVPPPAPAPSPPVITSFIGQRDGNWWIVSGTVSDDEPIGGGQIIFGEYLAGETALIQHDGTFVFYAVAVPDKEANVSAIAVDLDGLRSETAYTILPA